MNADARRWGERGLAALLLALAAAVLIWGAAQLPLLDALVFGFDWHNYWMMFRGGWPDYGAADIFNPPWTLLLLWPLAALPYKTGWALVTLGTLIILTLSVPRRADGLPDGWGLLALFSSFWVLRQLAEGNIAGMMVLGCLLLLRGLQRQEPWSLAVGGLLITAKYQESWLLALGAAAVVLRTWPARRRALAAGLTLAVAGPSLALLGGPWLSRLLTPSGFSPAIARLSGNISLNALRALPGFPDWGAASAVALVLALTGWALWRSAAQGAPAITRASAGFLLAASMLCAPYTGGASLTTLLAVGLVPLWRWRFWPGLGLWVFANLPLWAAHLTPLWRWPDLPQCLLALCLWIALGAQTLAEARTPAARRGRGGSGMRLWLRRHAGLWAALAVMIAGRAALLAADRVPFNADEAVVALMARHIRQGERPVFFYGQAYLGSLDAWLAAGAFEWLGESVMALRVVQAALYAGVILTAYLLARRVFGTLWPARFVALWLAVPPVTLTLYTTASLGGYGEALLIGNLIWLAAMRLIQPQSIDQTRDLSQRTQSPQSPRKPDSSVVGAPMAQSSHVNLAPGRQESFASLASFARAVFASSELGWLSLGALTGLGLWVFPLTGVYALPAWALALWAGRGAGWHRQLAHLALAAGGTALGAAPWLWYTATAGVATLAELSGSAIAGVSGLPPMQALAQQLLSLVLFGPTVITGLRPSWSIEMLALPLAPLAAAVYSAAVIRTLRRLGHDPAAPGRRLLLGAGATLCAAFVLTPFGADPSGRYFLPLTLVLAFLTADFLSALRPRWPRLAPSLALGLLAFNLWGTAQSAAAPAGLTTQFDPVTRVAMRDLPAVMDFLRAQGETRGYANYWVTFPLAFLSQEELIFAARLPYHLDFRYTPRDDRYGPYTRLAAESPRAAYITTRHPPLDDRLRAGFAALGVRYREHRIGDFQIFYALSRKVEPDELGLGSPCCR